MALDEFLALSARAVVEAPLEGQIPLRQNAKGLDLFRLCKIDELVFSWWMLGNIEFIQDLKA